MSNRGEINEGTSRPATTLESEMTRPKKAKISFNLSCQLLMTCLLLGASKVSSAAEKEHLLHPEDNLQRDSPLPLYKGTWEIIQENWVFLTIFLGAILLCSIILWLRKKMTGANSKEAEEKLERDPYEEALEALEALEAKRKGMKAKPFTFRLSEVLRVYVQRRFELPAMELTGEEFIREAAEHDFFRNHYDDLLREFIDRSDMVKYSRESIDGEGLILLMNSAKHFVRDTHRRLEKKLAEEAASLSAKAK
ncbi:MAG: hypothetical protein CMI31_06715 [Opitutae bacterium]|nr:hypothetical protein [Opitutae bacterium]|tara:strand:- start:623 stop:1375 length:753 start_codon:yes stop_codon:yes gene_type:complete